MPSTGVVEIKLTFKEGGAFDFSTHYERVRERLQQAVEVSRADGSGNSRGAMNGVDVANVNLEELPAYQERGDGPLIPPILPSASVPTQESAPQRDSGVAVEDDRTRRKPEDGTPVEPPPAYEEAQMAGLQDEVDRRLSGGRGESSSGA